MRAIAAEAATAWPTRFGTLATDRRCSGADAISAAYWWLSGFIGSFAQITSGAQCLPLPDDRMHWQLVWARGFDTACWVTTACDTARDKGISRTSMLRMAHVPRLPRRTSE